VSRERELLAGLGYVNESREYDGGRSGQEGYFESWRLGSINLIVTDRPAFFERFLAATALAKARNIMGKADRIRLFQQVLYG
jgi:hypothetical protein